MGIRIEGLDELEARLKKSVVGAAKELAGGLLVEGNKIMTRSKKEFVPVDKGPLKSSGHVQTPVIRKTSASVTLGFGGAASDYALVQHERTDFNHPGQGQAKYLEQPANEAKKGFGARIAKNIDLF